MKNIEDLISLSIDDLTNLMKTARAADASAEKKLPGRTEGLPDIEGMAPPLSYAQERLWFMDRLSPGNPFYNIPFGLEITGDLDVDALQHAWKAVIDRHECLRSVFPASPEGKPYLAFIDPAQCTVDVRDIRSLDDAEQDKGISQAMEAEVSTGFALEKGPLLRAILFVKRSDCHIFLHTFHHIAFDGWSIGIFMEELFSAYAAFKEDTSPAWEELPATYGQYALWQRRFIEGEHGECEFNWWKDYLSESSELELWADYVRPEVQSFKGETIEFTVPSPIRESLENLARRHNATPFMAWLAVYGLVLARYSGRREFIVGNSVSGRTHPDTEKMIGFFVNNLPIKLSHTLDMTFSRYLDAVRDSMLLSFEHSDLPFQLLAKSLGRHLDISRNPIYQASMTYQNTPEFKGIPDGLTLRNFSMPAKSSHLDIEMIVWPTPKGLYGCMLYATDLLKPETARNICSAFVALAEAVGADPERTVENLFANPTLLPLPPERAPSVISAPEEDFPFIPPLEYLRKRALENPNATALILCDDMLEYVPVEAPRTEGTVAVTSRQLFSMVEEAAADLADMPVGRGHITAVLLHSGVEMLVFLLAVWHRGGAWLPLDPQYPPARQREIIRATGADCVISTKEGWKKLGLKEAGLGECTWGRVKHWRSYAPSGRSVPPVTTKPEDVACIYHTSGSTGVPKGVPMTHGSLLYRLNWEWDRFPLNENDVLCQKSPSVFSDFFFETFGAMLAGVPFLLLGHGASRDVERLMNKMEQYGVTKVVMVASLLKAMHRLSNGLVGRLPKLRYIRTSGEPMEISLAEATVKAIPGVSIVNMFGSTEMLNPVSFHFTAASEGEFEPAAYVPAGLPLPGRITALLDENLLPVPWGECGMIYTAGPGLTPGYISGGTEQVFYQLSLTGEELRFFKSGDLGRLDDKGRLHYLGRKDHQIKIRGVRIESQEVQDAMNAFGDVQESVVVPWKDPDGNVRLVGFVIRQPDGNQKKDNDIFVQTLRAHLLECLPAVMVPELIRVLAEWPRTPSGKISRLLLLEQLNAQRVQPCVKRRGDSMEDALANLWRQVLGAEAGENLNFFEAGGNSLVLVSLHEKMQRKFSVRFPLTELFQNPTIESQARLLFRLAQHGLAKENGPERSLPSRDSRQASLGARRKAAAG